MLLASMGNAGAQSNRGPAFPTEAQRGAGISKRRLSAKNPTNWAVAPHNPNRYRSLDRRDAGQDVGIILAGNIVECIEAFVRPCMATFASCFLVVLHRF